MSRYGGWRASGRRAPARPGDADALAGQVDVEDNKGKSPLQHAAEGGMTKCIQWLLTKSANPNHEDRLGKTSIHAAAEKGYAHTRGARPWGARCLAWAARGNGAVAHACVSCRIVRELELLRDNGGDIRKVDDHGYTRTYRGGGGVWVAGARLRARGLTRTRTPLQRCTGLPARATTARSFG